MGKVLVTGGAGFIGSHLVEALVDRGDGARVLDNFSNGSRQNLAKVDSNVEIIEGDIRNKEDVRKALSGVETLIHLAAFISVPESLKKPEACFEVNVSATAGVLEAARQMGVSNVVLASSAAVYGTSSNMPLSESHPTQSLSPYAASKVFNEILAQLYFEAYGFPVKALRFFNVYGPRQTPGSPYAAAIPKFIEQLSKQQAPVLFGDGTQTRDFIFVEDVVQAVLLAAEVEEAAGKVINICSGKETSLLELLDLLYAFFPSSPRAIFEELRSGDVPRSLGDAHQADTVLGFRAQSALAEGLKQCVEASSR